MYAMSQIHQDIMTSSSQDSITAVSLMNGAKKRALLVTKDLPIGRIVCLLPLSAMVSSSDVLPLLSDATVVWTLWLSSSWQQASSVLENSLLIACTTAARTVIKGWNDFKKFFFKIDMCRFLNDLQQNIDRIENVRARASDCGV